MTRRTLTALVLLLWLAPAAAFGADRAGEIVFLRGQARVERDGKRLNAELKLPIMQGDVITTGEKSVVKVLCPDDSILTIAEQSRFTISEYLFNPAERRSTSVFKLLFGKIRVIVGRALLRVETETAVAGVRGTVFDIWFDTATHITYISVVEGAVEFRNIDANIKGVQIITGGNSSSVPTNGPPKPPFPTPPQPPGTSNQPFFSGPTDVIPPPPPPPATSGTQGGGAQTEGTQAGQVVTSTPPIQQTPQGVSNVGINVVFP
jgi:FecR protein